MDVFVELRRVDIDVDNGLSFGEISRVAQHPIGKSGAHRHKQVAFLDGEGGRLGSVHSQHPHIAGMGLIKAPLAHQGAGNGRVQPFRELRQLPFRPAGNNPAPGIQKGAFAGVKQVQHPVQLLPIHWVGDFRTLGRNRFKVVDGGGDVLGDIHQDGALPAAVGDIKGVPEGACQVLNPFDQKVVFGDGNGHAGDIHLLEAVQPQKGTGDVAGDGNQGDGIHIGCSDACHQVGGPRAGGGDADAGFAAGAGIAVCGVGGPLFVGGQHVLDAACLRIVV